MFRSCDASTSASCRLIGTLTRYRHASVDSRPWMAVGPHARLDKRLDFEAPGARIAVHQSDVPGLLVRLGWTSFYGRARRKLQLADPIELGHARKDTTRPPT